MLHEHIHDADDIWRFEQGVETFVGRRYGYDDGLAERWDRGGGEGGEDVVHNGSGVVVADLFAEDVVELGGICVLCRADSGPVIPGYFGPCKKLYVSHHTKDFIVRRGTRRRKQ